MARRHVNNQALTRTISNTVKSISHDPMMIATNKLRPHVLGIFKKVGLAGFDFIPSVFFQKPFKKPLLLRPTELLEIDCLAW